jgi:ectoine hydroxylase-related dioxygenase (phytanoyl-CoA dioxygenase family)
MLGLSSTNTGGLAAGRAAVNETRAEQQARVESYAAAERAAGIAEANRLRREGRCGLAHYVLSRSFIRQVRILGLSYAAIPGRPYEQGGPLA